MKYLYQLLFMCAFCFSANGQDGFYISDYHNRIEINEEGGLFVTERINVFFTEKRRGIFRIIRRKGQFKNHIQNIAIDNVHVENHPFKFSKKHGEYEIRIGDKDVYIEGAQEYIIKYRVQNAILNFENHEELFWTLIATEWKVPIRTSSYEIILPTPLDISEKEVVVYNGRSESLSQHASVHTEPGKVYGESLKILGQGLGMTIGVKLPKGYVYGQQAILSKKVVPPTPKPKDRAWYFPLALILGLIWSYMNWGRSNRLESPLTRSGDKKYFPPKGMNAAEVGTFYDDKVNTRDVVSMIPTWGNRGKIIMGMESESSGLFIQKIHELDGSEPEYEQYFFDMLFKDGNYVNVKELKNNFYQDFNQIKSLLKAHTLKDEYYDQETKGIFHSVWIILLGVFFIVLGILSMIIFHWWATGVGSILLGITCLVIRFLKKKKSQMGQRLHEQLVAFKTEISNPADNRLKEIAISDPDYFGKIFPYVVAFGMDKIWLEQFKDIFTKAPDWYHRAGVPYMVFGDFQRDYDIDPITKNIAIPPVADSSSSSFGGSGGGGVGGGFGGGGGGSW